MRVILISLSLLCYNSLLRRFIANIHCYSRHLCALAFPACLLVPEEEKETAYHY